MQLARLVTRAVVGGLFVGHGTQKLFGTFGGPGLSGTEQMMEALELRPARRNAVVAGIGETAGGALLALGLATPLATASLIGTMTTAIRKVHATNGPWVTNGGYEYNLVLIALLTGLTEAGPGDLSLDAALGTELKGTAWAFAALGLGVAASAAVVELGRRQPAPLGHAYPGAVGTDSGAADVAQQHPAGDPTTSEEA
jgi:putative oxidoreductase